MERQFVPGDRHQFQVRMLTLRRCTAGEAADHRSPMGRMTMAVEVRMRMRMRAAKTVMGMFMILAVPVSVTMLVGQIPRGIADDIGSFSIGPAASDRQRQQSDLKPERC
jgi:hypothetical protein